MNILGFCALDPERQFEQSLQSITSVDGLAALLFDQSDDPCCCWETNVFRKYQQARTLALAGNYDALMLLESDMVIPPDAVTQLAALDAPVAYGAYVLRHGMNVWNACVALDDFGGFFLTDTIVRENAPHEWNALQAGLPFQVYGSGFGCLLLRRDVLQEIPFRNSLGARVGDYHVDWLFAADCNARGIRQMLNPRVVCGHVDEDGAILYPDLTQPDYYRREENYNE